MQVRATVVINKGCITQLTKTAIIALELTAEALHTEVIQAEVMPRDEGTLQNEKFFVDHSQSSKGRVALCFEGPYARRLYYHPEYNFSRDENIAAGGRWLEPWLKGGLRQDFCNKSFIKLYKRLGSL